MKKQEFTKQTAHGPETASGYVFGAFGVEPDGYRCWWITHIPTGACFLYSEWETLERAREFCERMMKASDWQFAISDRATRARFNTAAHVVAGLMGARPRSCKMIA